MSCPRSESNLQYLWKHGIRQLVSLSPETLPPNALPNLKRTLIAVEEFEPPTPEDIVTFISICEQSLLNNEVRLYYLTSQFDSHLSFIQNV